MLRSVALLVLVGCGEVEAEPPLGFGLRLVPESMNAQVGQLCVVLVQTTMPPTLRSAAISVAVDAPFNLVGRELPGGGAVSEIEIEPDGTAERVQVRVGGDYQGQGAAVTGAIDVVAGEDHRAGEARQRLGMFLTFLEEELPDEGIHPATRWRGTPVLDAEPERYLFFSRRWEIGVSWRDAWTRIYLRRRFAEAQPSLAFRARSLDEPPVRCPPPATVDR